MFDLLRQHPAKKAIILGSGVSVFETKTPVKSISYQDIPGFPVGKVKGHKGFLDIYENIWVLRGRAHIYEGFSWQEACFATNLVADFGVEELIVTNSAGGINSKYEIGDLMQIKSYLNFLQPQQQRGNLNSITREPVAFASPFNLSGANIHQGCYVAVHGPNYETDAEVALFRKLGADAVGMSTVPELETAIERKMKITAVSIITNVYGKTDDLGHEGVLKVAKNSSAKLVSALGIA